MSDVNTRLQAELAAMTEELDALMKTAPYDAMSGDLQWRTYVLIQIALLRVNKRDK